MCFSIVLCKYHKLWNNFYYYSFILYFQNRLRTGTRDRFLFSTSIIFATFKWSFIHFPEPANRTCAKCDHFSLTTNTVMAGHGW